MTILKQHKTDFLALATLIGGWYANSPVAFNCGLGYLSSKINNYIFLNLISFNTRQTDIRQTRIYQNIKPYVPEIVDKAIELYDKIDQRTLPMVCGVINGWAGGFSKGMASCTYYIAGYAIDSVMSYKKVQNHDYGSWLDRSKNQDMTALLKEIADENINITWYGDYKTQSGKTVIYTNPSLVENTRVVNRDEDLSEIRRKPSAFQKDSEVSLDGYFDVPEMDCLYAYEAELKKGHKPALLNNANGDHAGGEYLKGACAQEEDLLRRIPDLYRSLDHIQKYGDKHSGRHYYKTPNTGCIYTPGAKIARHGQDEGYKLLEEPISIDVITSAASNLNSKTEGADKDTRIMGILGFIEKLNTLDPQTIKVIGQAVFKSPNLSRLDNKDHNMRFRDFISALNKISDLKIRQEILFTIFGDSKEKNPQGFIDGKRINDLWKDGYEKFTKDKMFWQIKTAIETGHDTLIISEWGCEAFGNKPDVITRYYKDVYKKHFKGQIRLIFPILNDINRSGNLTA
ncbi:MAG: TIGR02452 family protein, partial [Parachlamydiales bacterium]